MSEEELKRMEDFVNATLKPDKSNEYRLGYEDALRRCYYLVDNLQQENKELKEKLKLYEEPDDMTLMFMWCDEKTKDKIKELKQALLDIKEYIKEKRKSGEIFYINEVEKIVNKALGDKENE